jgi:AcrR family transcriptional regulator
MGDLMRDLRLTHGGFYRHFKSKEELFAQVFEHSLEQVRQRFAPAVAVCGRDALSESETSSVVSLIAICKALKGGWMLDEAFELRRPARTSGARPIHGTASR